MNTVGCGLCGNSGAVFAADKFVECPQCAILRETVNHPSHYRIGRFEVIEVIEDWKLNFSLGNAVKYIARAGKKDPLKEVEDLEKAAWYIQRQIDYLKSFKSE